MNYVINWALNAFAKLGKSEQGICIHRYPAGYPAGITFINIRLFTSEARAVGEKRRPL